MMRRDDAYRRGSVAKNREFGNYKKHYKYACRLWAGDPNVWGELGCTNTIFEF